jgi:hypothetical protein
VERWIQAASGRNRRADNLIAGLIPRAQGVSDPDMAQALAERDQAMEERARTLADWAVESGESWVERLGIPPVAQARREHWMRELSAVAAYRDRWHITGASILGLQRDANSTEQTGQRQRAQVAAARAMAINGVGTEHQNSPSTEVAFELHRGVEL